MCRFDWIVAQRVGTVREPPLCETRFVSPRRNTYEEGNNVDPIRGRTYSSAVHEGWGDWTIIL